MTERILIRSSESRWPAYLLGGFSVLLILAGLLVGLFPQLLWLAFTLVGIGLVLLMTSFYVEAQRIRQLMYISLEERRFTILDRISERSFADDDIVSIALQYKDNFDNGNHTSTTRTFRVWVVASGDRPELIEMKSKIKVGESDPLTGFINRVVSLLKNRADQELLKNQSVLGEGWELTNKSLLLRNAVLGEMEIPLKDLATVMLVEDNLKLWKLGEEAAFASIPLQSANAHLLHLMLEQEFARRPELIKQEPLAGQLGRILFERKPQRSVGLTVAGIAVLMIMSSIVIAGLLLAGAIPKREIELMTGVAVGLALLSVLLFIAAWITFKTLFRCHEHGVYLRGAAGEKKLLYSEIESFTYSATKHYHNGAYLGTYLKLAFDPLQTAGKPKIVYKTTIKNADNALDHLRDMISEMIGTRLFNEVMSGKTVNWTEKLILEPGRLRYQPAGFFRRKPFETISYAMISHHTMHQGTLSLFQHGKPKPFVNSSSTARNFFPGYSAFINLMEMADGTASELPEAVLEETHADQIEES